MTTVDDAFPFAFDCIERVGQLVDVALRRRMENYNGLSWQTTKGKASEK